MGPERELFGEDVVMFVSYGIVYGKRLENGDYVLFYQCEKPSLLLYLNLIQTNCD